MPLGFIGKFLNDYRDHFVSKMIALACLESLAFRVWPDSPVTLTLIPLVVIFPAYFVIWISLGSITAFFAQASVFYTFPFDDLSRFWLKTQSGFQPDSTQIIEMHILAKLLVILLASFFLKVKWRVIERYPIWAALILLLALQLASEFLAKLSLPGAFVLVSAAVIWRILFFPLVIVRSRRILRQDSVWRNLYLIVPFWNLDLIPYWNIRKLQWNARRANQAGLERWNVILLCLMAHIILSAYPWLDDYVYSFIPHDLGKPSVFGSKLQFIQRAGNPIVAWILIIYTFLEAIIVTYGAKLAVTVLVLRNIGFHEVFPMNSPAKAKSFHEFVGRVFYYYNQLLVELVLIPISPAFRIFNRWKKLRNFLLVFLSVLMFGGLFHFLYRWQDVIKFGLFRGGFLYFQTQFLFYMLVCSFSIAISVIVDHWQRKNESKHSHWFRWACFMALYSLLLTLTYDQNESWSHVFALLKFLFLGIKS